MGKTIAEYLSRKMTKSLEVGEHADKNPLGVKVGNRIAIGSGSDTFVKVTAIAHAVERINGKDYPFTDYHLDGASVADILRVFPVEKSDSILKHSFLVLTKFYECDYETAKEENLYNIDFDEKDEGIDVPPALQDPNGQFNDFETGEVYTRRFMGYAGWEKPHDVTYTKLTDVDGSGKVDKDEVEVYHVQFWDYERQVKVGNSSRERTEFLYVEQDEDGFFRLYDAEEIPQEFITIF
jgi:hypothetical protein